MTVRCGSGTTPLYQHSDGFVVLDIVTPARGDERCIAIVVGSPDHSGAGPPRPGLAHWAATRQAPRRFRAGPVRTRWSGLLLHAPGACTSSPARTGRNLREVGPDRFYPRKSAVPRIPGRASPIAGRRSGGAMGDDRGVLIAELGPRLPEVDPIPLAAASNGQPTRESCGTGQR